MGYREERRADRAAEREQSREDQRLLLDARLEAKRLEAEERRRDQAQEQERARRDAAEKRRLEAAERRQHEQAKERRKAARAAKLTKVSRWLRANPATLFVGFVMAASVVPAVISQVGALAEARVPLLLAALLAAMLEGGAWAITFMGKQADDAGRPTRKYRAGTWATAAAAAGVNVWHGSQSAPLWVAAVFGGSSLFAIFIWDLKVHGSQGPTREDRQTARERRRHARMRRRHHRSVARMADRLLSAAPFGELTDGDAFTAAWRIQYGTDPGMTPTLYERATAARLALGEAIESASEKHGQLTRSSLLSAWSNPFPGSLGDRLPVFGETVPVPVHMRAAEAGTAQFPQGKHALPAGAENGPQGAAGNGPEAAAADRRKTAAERGWEQHLDRARTVATELVAEGRTISATALAKRLAIRREDAMKLRDAVIAERKNTA
jgi:hypothetical protein